MLVTIEEVSTYSGLLGGGFALVQALGCVVHVEGCSHMQMVSRENGVAIVFFILVEPNVLSTSSCFKYVGLISVH